MIITDAAEVNADLVVMLAYGHAGIAPMIPGRVVERVVCETKWPLVSTQLNSGASDSVAVQI